jgi:hypothetical protein
MTATDQIRQIITRRSKRADRERLLGADGGNADSDMLGPLPLNCAAKPQVPYDRAIAKGLSAAPAPTDSSFKSKKLQQGALPCFRAAPITQNQESKI